MLRKVTRFQNNLKNRKHRSEKKASKSKKEKKDLLEIVVVHFQGKAFNPGNLLVYWLADVRGGPIDMGT
jgi:hypothetical protein